MASAVVVRGPGRPGRGLVLRLIGGRAGDAVGLGEPAAEIDVGAAGRAEGPIAIDCRLAADRAGPLGLRRDGAGVRGIVGHIPYISKGSRLVKRPDPPQCEQASVNVS